MIFGVNKFPARKHHISLNVLWCAESNGYSYTLLFSLTICILKFWLMWSDELIECVAVPWLCWPSLMNLPVFSLVITLVWCGVTSSGPSLHMVVFIFSKPPA